MSVDTSIIQKVAGSTPLPHTVNTSIVILSKESVIVTTRGLKPWSEPVFKRLLYQIEKMVKVKLSLYRLT
jgi:hypothetical protein